MRPFLSRTMTVIFDILGTLDISRSSTTLPRKPVAPVCTRRLMKFARKYQASFCTAKGMVGVIDHL